MKKIDLTKIKETMVILSSLTVGLTVVIKGIIGLMDEMKLGTYLSFYGIEKNIITINKSFIISNLLVAILIALCLLSILKSIYDIILNLKDKDKNNNKLWYDYIIVIISNVIITIFLRPSSLFMSIILFIILIVFEYLMAKVIFGDVNVKDNVKEELKLYFKILPFLLFGIIISNAMLHFLELYTRKEYKLLNENQVMIYANEDSYVLLDCVVDRKGKLIIYKGSQTIISSQNVNLKSYIFSKSEIKSREFKIEKNRINLR